MPKQAHEFVHGPPFLNGTDPKTVKLPRGSTSPFCVRKEDESNEAETR